MKRRWFAVLGCLASIAMLGGCIFSYDAARPSVMYQNRLDERVIVSLEDTELPSEQTVRSHGEVFFEMDECLGTAIVVETEDGDYVGKVDQPACPDWMLTINEDGTLDYAEQTVDSTEE
ncbi:MAG: hypothetical protein ACOH10_14265 [Rhodoglobus sp.]